MVLVMNRPPMALAALCSYKKVWTRRADAGNKDNNDTTLVGMLADFHAQLLRTLAKKAGQHATTLNDSMASHRKFSLQGSGRGVAGWRVCVLGCPFH